MRTINLAKNTYLIPQPNILFKEHDSSVTKFHSYVYTSEALVRVCSTSQRARITAWLVQILARANHNAECRHRDDRAELK